MVFILAFAVDTGFRRVETCKFWGPRKQAKSQAISPKLVEPYFFYMFYMVGP
jgi:hypothetical protein